MYASLNKENEKHAAELIIANKELVFQNAEKEKRAAELIIANKELVFQNGEKEKRAAELIIANKELVFQNGEKEKRAAELIIANKELVFQNGEKEKRAAELAIANKELAFQNGEKEKRAAELITANKELIFQNGEKEKRAAELIIANKELVFQNGEKEKRAAELAIANKELVFQNAEKEKRASELISANKELVFQNVEKEKLAIELATANKELIYQNAEKEKHAIELTSATQQLKDANAELEAFSYSVSHDLRAPLRGIIGFANILEEDYISKLDDEAKRITSVIKANTLKMGHLVDDLLAFSKMGRQRIVKNNVNTGILVQEVIANLLTYSPRNIEWIVPPLPDVTGDISLLRQVWINLISNAIKYSGKTASPCIEIGSSSDKGQIIFYVKDNGVGFNEKYKDKLFKVFQRLHSADEFEGTGVGLAITEKIISKHGGRIWANAAENKGATFSFSIPGQEIKH